MEISPDRDSVNKHVGRLQRCFPGPAVTIPTNVFSQESFREPFADLLCDLSENPIAEAQPQAVAYRNANILELKDPASPRFVTEMVAGMLRGVGGPHESVQRIIKHTRDDIMFDGVNLPWRRSPMWLFVRVVLQTTLMEASKGSAKKRRSNHFRYKSFMLFLMCGILENTPFANVGCERIYIMLAKISRRAVKLEIEKEPVWWSYIQKVVKKSRKMMEVEWNVIQEEPDPAGVMRPWSERSGRPELETELSLHALRPYLNGIQMRQTLNNAAGASLINCRHRIILTPTAVPSVATLNSIAYFPVGSPERALFLADVELWVEECLSGYMAEPGTPEEKFAALLTVIRWYIQNAPIEYDDRTEDRSRMLLTLLEMWKAIDSIAISLYPLIGEYCPEILAETLNPLILPSKAQMDRLVTLSGYLDSRKKKATAYAPSVFKMMNSTQSFPARYFDQSEHHQKLAAAIDKLAQKQRDLKVKELKKLKHKYKDLKKKVNRMECTFPERRWFRRILLNCYRGNSYGHQEHKCRKCVLKKKAEDMRIQVHEWPLPNDPSEKKALIFELDVPPTIAQWRDVTYIILADFLTHKDLHYGAYTLYQVGTCPGLEQWLGTINSGAFRMKIKSIAPSFTKLHYTDMAVSAAEEDTICVKHGLTYGYYDSMRSMPTRDIIGPYNLWKKLQYVLPDGPYKPMQKYLTRTTHQSNEVIAARAECPAELPIDEHHDFGTLRSGGRLQWLNIARQIRAQNLNFNRDETELLILQAAWQVGPLVGGSWEWHDVVSDESIGNSLVEALSDALKGIERNWQGATAMRTYILLTTRLLSLNPCESVQKGCLNLLEMARAAALVWCAELSTKLQECPEEDRDEVGERLFEAALTCSATFGVEVSHFPSLLSSTDAVRTLVKCCILVNEQRPLPAKLTSTKLWLLLRRHENRMHRMERTLRDILLQDSCGLDDAISQIWQSYKRGEPWTAMNVPNDRWLFTTSASDGVHSSITVQYNVIDGSLYLNGFPLTRLPTDYESHPIYTRVFGKVSL